VWVACFAEYLVVSMQSESLHVGVKVGALGNPLSEVLCCRCFFSLQAGLILSLSHSYPHVSELASVMPLLSGLCCALVFACRSLP
jgi:hypothetical protein